MDEGRRVASNIAKLATLRKSQGDARDYDDDGMTMFHQLGSGTGLRIQPAGSRKATVAPDRRRLATITKQSSRRFYHH